MSVTNAFIINRAQKSCAVATAIAADWVFEEFTVAQYFDKKASVEAQLDWASATEAAMLSRRGIMDAAIDALHAKIKQIVPLARIKWRNDATKKALLDRISAQGNTRTSKREELKVVLNVWPNLDPDWEPLGFQLDAYIADRVAIEGDDTAVPKVKGFVDLYDDAHGDWRAKAEALNTMADALEADNVAWYAAATATFLAGTTNGDLIRGQVPTTYDPANEPLPLPGKPMQVIAGPTASPGEAQIAWLNVTFATEYLARITYEESGSPQEVTATVTTNSALFTGLPTGVELTITITPSNTTGPGPESDPVTLTLA